MAAADAVVAVRRTGVLGVHPGTSSLDTAGASILDVVVVVGVTRVDANVDVAIAAVELVTADAVLDVA
jgi:hypothetical protein